MSIASEITRLQTAKGDIKTAIENKGVSVASNLTISSYASKIDEITTGLEIQNGVVGSYKSSSGTIPAGTFVNLEYHDPSGYKLLDNTSLTGYACDGITVGDYVIILTDYYTSSYGSRAVHLEVLKKSGNSVSYITDVSLSGTGVSSPVEADSNSKVYLFKIDNSHFVVFQAGTPYSKPVRTYSIENDTLTLIDNQNYSASDFGIPTSSPSFRNVTTTESNEYFYIHNVIYASNVTYLYGVKISKSDYTSTPITAVGNLTAYGIYSITSYDDNKLLGVVGQRGYLINFDTSTDTYSVITSVSISPLDVNNALFVKMNGDLFILYKSDYTSLSYAKITISGTTLTVSGYNTINFEKSIFRYIMEHYSVLNNKFCILANGYANPGCWCICISYNNGNLNIGTPLNIASNMLPYGVPTGMSCSDGTYIYTFGGSASKNSAGTDVYVVKNTIDSANNLVDVTGERITVTTATSTIDGLTKTDCSTSTAGEVYLLEK